MASLLFVSLPISLFILPIGYTYDEICSRCQGDGIVTCETCHGSGICWVCDGTGRIWYMPDDGWCGACQGTGKCYTCGGKGWHTCGKCGGSGLLVYWMYNLLGATVVPSFVSVLLFLGLFILGYVVSAFYLSFNEWIYQVEDMGFWFNPSFMTWLFARHRKRWAKWTTGYSSVLSIYLGALFFVLLSLNQLMLETFVAGVSLSIPIVTLFSWFVYKSYTSKIAESQ